jgi:hypothetical protein
VETIVLATDQAGNAVTIFVAVLPTIRGAGTGDVEVGGEFRDGRCARIAEGLEEGVNRSRELARVGTRDDNTAPAGNAPNKVIVGAANGGIDEVGGEGPARVWQGVRFEIEFVAGQS